MYVRSYVAHGARLSARTYDWGAPSLSTGDPRLDNNPFFHDRVRTAVDRELARRGFEKAADPALRIEYHASTSEDLVFGASLPEFDFAGGRAEVHEKGRLVIDLTDAATGQLVWRGWAETGIDGVVNDQRWMEHRIDETVARILRELDRLRVPDRPI
jgi:hypothetical protein